MLEPPQKEKARQTSSAHSHLGVRAAGEGQRCEQSGRLPHKERGCGGGDALTQARAEVAASVAEGRGREGFSEVGSAFSSGS